MSTVSSRDKTLAFAFGTVFLLLMLVITLFIPEPTETQWFTFRLTLALAAAGIGAVIPGFISVHVKSYVRAGGALAMFVLVFATNPPQLLKSDTPVLREEVVNDMGTAEQSMKKGEYDAAISAYQRVLAKDPGNSLAKSGIERARKAKDAERRLTESQ